MKEIIKSFKKLSINKKNKKKLNKFFTKDKDSFDINDLIKSFNNLSINDNKKNMITFNKRHMFNHIFHSPALIKNIIRLDTDKDYKSDIIFDDYIKKEHFAKIKDIVFNYTKCIKYNDSYISIKTGSYTDYKYHNFYIELQINFKNGLYIETYKGYIPNITYTFDDDINDNLLCEIVLYNNDKINTFIVSMFCIIFIKYNYAISCNGRFYLTKNFFNRY